MPPPAASHPGQRPAMRWRPAGSPGMPSPRTAAPTTRQPWSPGPGPPTPRHHLRPTRTNPAKSRNGAAGPRPESRLKVIPQLGRASGVNQGTPGRSVNTPRGNAPSSEREELNGPRQAIAELAKERRPPTTFSCRPGPARADPGDQFVWRYKGCRRRDRRSLPVRHRGVPMDCSGRLETC